MTRSSSATPSDPTLSVVVVNYRSWECLQRCLESLLGSGHAVTREITVVDNASADGRLESFRGRFPDVTFIASPENLGFAYGCNLGAHAARGELLLFVNPDVRIESGQLDRLIEQRRRYPDVRIMTAIQVDESGRPQKAFDAFPTFWSTLPGGRALQRSFAPSRYPHPRRPHVGLVRCDWVSGAVLLIDRADFEELGGWSESFWMYHEDVDLCRRASERGWSVACTPRATLIHAHGGSTRQDTTVEALTRAETVISRHVYISRHHRGFDAAAFHASVALQRMFTLSLAKLVNLLTLHRVRSLRVRGRVWSSLVAYYAGRGGADGWISPRAPGPRGREVEADDSDVAAG